MSDESDLQKLLRLKRYEQPPEGYFEDFLSDFQRRQRLELMRRPAYEVAWERVTGWLDSVRVPAVAYAAILVVGAGVTGMILTGPRDSGNAPQFASTSAPSTTFSTATVSLPQPSPNSALPPSYVLETRPVSYESPFSF
jgi:negative regulator of sigma E activity